MGFEVPQRTALNPTEFEEFYRDSWNIFGDEVLRLQELGRAAALQGKKSVASKYYRGANIYFYMMYLAIAAREKQGLLLLTDDSCYAKTLEDQYKLACVESNLPCLSSDFDTDYTEAWEQLIALFGIDRNVEACEAIEEDCRCVGISQMIIDHDDDCKAFIVGPCEENTLPDSGEFSPCEFAPEEFTEAIGDNVYDNCGPRDEDPCNCN